MIENKFRNYALITILTVVFTIASTLPLGVLTMLFSALLVALLGYTVTKYHYTFVTFICVSVFGLYSLFTADILTSVYATVPVVLCGLSLGIGYKLEFSDFKTISVVSAVYSLYTVLNMKFTGIADNFQSNIIDSIQSLAPLYENQISQADFNTLMSVVLNVLMRFTPSFLIIICICYGLVFFWEFKKILKITRSDMSVYSSFSDWHADKTVSIVYFVLAVISFLLPTGNFISDAFANVITVSSFVFFIFGLSYVDFMLKMNMKNSSLRKVILILLTILILPVFGLPYILLSVLGAMDGCFNYRKKFIK